MLHRDITQFAIVITHTTADQRLPDPSWLEAGYRVEESDWVHLSPEGWRAAADGDSVIWEALARKLMIGYYARQPDLIAVVGHAGGTAAADAETVRRIARRVRSLLLPAAVLGFWIDELGAPTALSGSNHDDYYAPASGRRTGEWTEEAEAVA